MKPESLMMTYGYNPEWSEGAIKTPIYQTSTFVFKTAEEGKRFFAMAYGKMERPLDEPMGLIYSRINNPNLQILEERLALYEGTDDAAVFESGMSGISTVMLSFLRPGDVLIFSNPTYGGTHHFIRHVLTDFGIEVYAFNSSVNVDEMRLELSEKGLLDRVRMIYIETPANPTNELIDIAPWAKFRDELKSKGNEIKLVVDNTYMGPLWQKPMELGADLVCYSATKFLNGHSDLIAGVVCGEKQSMIPVKTMRTFIGNMAGPHTSWLLTRSVETLKLRMDRQGANAQKIVEWLLQHPAISRVYYPGLASQGADQVEIFKRQCTHPGAMISFDVKGGEKSAFAVLNALKLIKLAVSLGSNESLAQHPYSMTHADVPDDVKESLNLTDAMIRLSVGIEDSEDIISDLKQALNSIS
ncbi:MAG: cystathionine gamma-synthase family protein [Flavobacteriales bacterium]|nr:MAG: cystathionine gamma-synthase family protein [Flavobacteriales bacterium]